ncbi:MAG TPA: hypothetical protein PK264_22150, partial [Hyphomicrobiaceae bacterium]|nr:hypothetical protein [Hyphomicrobiaceae bacterium]
GLQVSDEAVSRMQCEGGATGYVDIVARLLAATFGTSEPPAEKPVAPPADAAWPASKEEERRPPDPFPGTR